MRLQWHRFLLLASLIHCLEGYKIQSCDLTREPFQVTYSDDCGRACFQQCTSEPDLSKHCVSLPRYCQGFPATCGNSGCECIPSLQLPGNPYSRESLSDHMIEKIICEDSEIEVRINKCAVYELGFTLDDFYMNGLATTSHIPSVDNVTLKNDTINSCRGRIQISEAGMIYVFRVSTRAYACNGFAEVDTETSTVTIYNAIKATTRQITQRHAIYVMFSCTYVLGPHYTQLAPEIRPKSHEIQIYSGNLHDDFNVTLDLWLDQFHQSRYFYADKLATQEYIYSMIGATIDDWDRYKVQILQATVMSSPHENDQYFIPLITNGCVESSDTHGTVLLNNGDSTSAEFKFRVFPILQLSVEEQIYIHVVAHLCDEIFEGTCEIDCSQRRRRSITIPEMHTKNVTSSPITVLKWHKKINDTGRNITVMEALQYITESWEMTLMITCVLLLILTLMISMCVLLMKLSKNATTKTVEK